MHSSTTSSNWPAPTNDHHAHAVDLARLSADRIDTWTAVAESRHVELRTDGLDTPVIVEAVPGAIEQILDNLLDNALNAAPAGSTITVTITTGADEHQLRISRRRPRTRRPTESPRHPPVLAGHHLERRDRTRLGHRRRPGSASGGHLELSDAPSGGLTVTVTFRDQAARSAV